MNPVDSTPVAGQYLTFFLAGEEYAVPILRVREILEIRPLTRVPTTPAFIRGVINVRGSVVPVVDLAIKLRMSETVITKWTCVVIVEVDSAGERLVVGVMADAVSKVVDLGAADVEPPPAFGTRVRVEYLRGLGKVGGKGFALILDVDRVLSSEDLAAAAGAGDEVQPGDESVSASEAREVDAVDTDARESPPREGDAG